MAITRKILSVLELFLLSCLTYLKALPFLIIVYFIPAVFLMLFTMPFVSAKLLVLLPADTSLVQGAWVTKALLLNAFVNTPNLVFLTIAYAFFTLYSIVFCFLLVEGLVNRERSGLFHVFTESFAAIGRYFCAVLTYAGVMILFLVLPLLPFYFFKLTPAYEVCLWAIWIVCVIMAAAFVFTSIFFTRAAVLRNKWPKDIFYYSYKIVLSRPFKLLVFLITIAIAYGVLYNIGQMFSGLLIGIIISALKINAATAYIPLYIVLQGLIAFFPAVALTVYFLNIDYNINSDKNRLELYARTSAINDKSMPSLK